MFGPFGFPGIFPGFGFGGILPSYIPYLVANGFGKCNCSNPLQNLPSFIFQPLITPFPFTRRFW
jgi:hypothetical protein